jgi:DNA polymerase-3 subunit delta'
LVLERVVNEKTGKLFTETRVEQVRASVSFFGSTAGEGGWRVAIVDPIEDLNRNGINALLKVLEEPPQRALLLLMTDAPGRVLPTIRSRCRTLILRPLAAEDVARATAAALGETKISDEIRTAAAAADGSVGRALRLLEGDALELREQMVAVLERLPDLDPRALHALGDEIAGTDAESLAAFMDTVNAWLGDRLKTAPQEARRLARIAEVWSSVNKAGRETEAYNLDRKPFVFSVFGQLAEAARD